jgi:hypothetical protein
VSRSCAGVSDSIGSKSNRHRKGASTEEGTGESVLALEGVRRCPAPGAWSLRSRAGIGGRS